VLCFTAEEVWLTRFAGEGSSVHLMRFAAPPSKWRDEALARKWDKLRDVRRVITGALEIERQVKKTIGSALEAAPEVYVTDSEAVTALEGVDIAEMAITSDAKLIAGEAPADAFRLDDVKGVAVVFHPAQGRKCARSWKISPDVGKDKDFPDITPRDADAVREWQKRNGRTLFA
jgi:isoleucyl-tRNA synthetase